MISKFLCCEWIIDDLVGDVFAIMKSAIEYGNENAYPKARLDADNALVVCGHLEQYTDGLNKEILEGLIRDGKFEGKTGDESVDEISI